MADSSSGGCWNRCRINIRRKIGRDAIGMIGRYSISCSFCQYRYSCCEINWDWIWNWSFNHSLNTGLFYYVPARPDDASDPPINFTFLP